MVSTLIVQKYSGIYTYAELLEGENNDPEALVEVLYQEHGAGFWTVVHKHSLGGVVGALFSRELELGYSLGRGPLTDKDGGGGPGVAGQKEPAVLSEELDQLDGVPLLVDPHLDVLYCIPQHHKAAPVIRQSRLGRVEIEAVGTSQKIVDTEVFIGE